MKAEYQRLYAELFRLLMAGRWHTQEAEVIRRRMDAMPPGGREGDRLKEAWGKEAGWPLYNEAISR